jgi:DNA-binding NarL/FixJ family response regulator
VENHLGLPFHGEHSPDTPSNSNRRRPPELTTLELEVLKLIAHPQSNAEIAKTLFISEHTARTNVARILSKLNLHDRTQAAALASESGLVRPGARN